MKCETDKVCNYLNNKNTDTVGNFIQIMLLIIYIYIYVFIYSFVHSFIKQSSVGINSLHTKEGHAED